MKTCYEEVTNSQSPTKYLRAFRLHLQHVLPPMLEMLSEANLILSISASVPTPWIKLKQIRFPESKSISNC
jgi:hypothetical protein